MRGGLQYIFRIFHAISLAQSVKLHTGVIGGWVPFGIANLKNYRLVYLPLPILPVCFRKVPSVCEHDVSELKADCYDSVVKPEGTLKKHISAFCVGYVDRLRNIQYIHSLIL